MKKYLNENLPQEQRLGQVGMSNKYGEMKIVEYRKYEDIDVYFKEYNKIVKHKIYSNFLKGNIGVDINYKKNRLGEIRKNNNDEDMIIVKYNKVSDITIKFIHNYMEVKTTYSNFLKGEIKNPLYYQEKYEGQMRKANNGQMMLLLIYNDAMNCVVEFEDGTLVDCRYKCFNNGSVINPNYNPQANEFYYNDKLECWVGITNKGDKFLFSHPDEEVVEYIKKCTWRKSKGYICNSNSKKLHSLIRPIPNELETKYNMIDHINNDPLDNRYENLRYSNAKENARNKKSSGNSGITGFKYDKKRHKWYGTCNGIYTKMYKHRNEALIDLLITQKLLNYTHNEHLFYMLDDVLQERIDFVEHYIKEKIEKQKNIEYTVTCHNTFEKIDDDTYRMYDSKGRSCLIDVEDIERIKLGNWYCANTDKIYMKGIIINNKKENKIRLHRYLLGLIDIKYSKFIADHLDSNSLNNKKDNLIITDITGNNINIFGKGYSKLKEKYTSKIKNLQSRSFDNKQEAINFYNHYKQMLLSGRLQWKTKEELDKWLENIEQQGLDIDEVIKEHYEKLYSYAYNLIEVEYPKKIKKRRRE